MPKLELLTLFITCLPATYSACGRVIEAVVTHDQWNQVGMVTQTKSTRRRPAASYQVSERTVTLYNTTYRAVVIHSSSQDQCRQQRFAREMGLSSATLAAAVGEATRQEYFCCADAEAAADRVRALQSSYHQV
jgi:hypothetical protein